jgi:hypothetical protein
MNVPITNGYGFVYPRFEMLENKTSNELLAIAANKEIDGDIHGATFIYSKHLSTNTQAQEHLKRIEEDKNSSRAQQLLNLAEKHYGNGRVEARAYDHFLRYHRNDTGIDTKTIQNAEKRLNDLKSYIRPER